MQWRILLESYSIYQAGLPTALRIARQLACSNEVLSLWQVCNLYAQVLFLACIYLLHFLQFIDQSVTTQAYLGSIGAYMKSHLYT